MENTAFQAAVMRLNTQQRAGDDLIHHERYAKEYNKKMNDKRIDERLTSTNASSPTYVTVIKSSSTTHNSSKVSGCSGSLISLK